MYNFFKMFLAIGIIRKYRRNLFTIGISIIFMYVTIYIIEDLLKIVEKQDKLPLYFGKWLVLIVFIFIIFYNIYSMFRSKVIDMPVAIQPKFESKNNKPKSSSKEHILKSDSLETKGESIIKKYKKA
jgi:UDP-N-acetylmuramyl pentapeptide phosphotransferase/UDP-N-acetylglucosamine-1-phosphate transferase